MIGTMNGKIVYVPFAKAVKHDKGIDRKGPRTGQDTLHIIQNAIPKLTE